MLIFPKISHKNEYYKLCMSGPKSGVLREREGMFPLIGISGFSAFEGHICVALYHAALAFQQSILA